MKPAKSLHAMPAETMEKFQLQVESLYLEGHPDSVVRVLSLT